MMKPCMTPACQKPRHARGLCHSCHSAALRAVKQGHTTWDRLESAGFALPSYSARSNAALWTSWASSQINQRQTNPTK